MEKFVNQISSDQNYKGNWNSVKYNLELLNEVFKEGEEEQSKYGAKYRNILKAECEYYAALDERARRNMSDIKIMFYKILEDGKYEEIELPPNQNDFDFNRAFYLVTDEDYLMRKLENDDLNRRIYHITIDGNVQIVYCPPTENDIEALFKMMPDIRIAGVYSSTVLKSGKYKDQKVSFSFFCNNKETHKFSKEELIDRVCSSKEVENFQEEVNAHPDVIINELGTVVRWEKPNRTEALKKFME